MADRISQEVVEAEVVADPNARVSQDVVEAEVTATPNARVSQDVVEAETVGTPLARVSQAVVEAEVVTARRSRISQLVVEILVPNIEVFMPLLYPKLPTISYSTFWEPKFFNLPTQVLSTGGELDLGIADTPLHNFTLTYDCLREQIEPGTREFRTMLGFFGAMGGNLGRFLFKNVDDYTVKAQVIGTTDGTTRLYTLVRTFGLGPYVWTEPVGYVDVTCPFNLYLDGVLQPASSYSVQTTQPVLQQVQFTGTPAADQVITVDMNYFYYCKLSDPSLNFEKFMDRLWTLKKVKLQSNRPNT